MCGPFVAIGLRFSWWYSLTIVVSNAFYPRVALACTAFLYPRAGPTCSFGRTSFTHASLLRARTSLFMHAPRRAPTDFLYTRAEPTCSFGLLSRAVCRSRPFTHRDAGGPGRAQRPSSPTAPSDRPGDGHIQSPRSSPRIRRSHAARSTVPTSCVLPGTFVLSGGLGKYP